VTMWQIVHTEAEKLVETFDHVSS